MLTVASRKSARRARSQIVIALGEGEKGRDSKATLEAAAKEAGKLLSAWARDVLLAAAGELTLEDRVDWLETRGQEAVHELEREQKLVVDALAVFSRSHDFDQLKDIVDVIARRRV